MHGHIIRIFPLDANVLKVSWKACLYVSIWSSLFSCGFSLCSSISDHNAHNVDKLLHFLNQLSSNHQWYFGLCTSHSHWLVFSVQLPSLCVHTDCHLANIFFSAGKDSIFQLWSGMLFSDKTTGEDKLENWCTSDITFNNSMRGRNNAWVIFPQQNEVHSQLHEAR